MNENDSKNSYIVWTLSFTVVSFVDMFLDDYSYGLKNNYSHLLTIDIIELIVVIMFIIFPVVFDYFKSKAANLTIKKYYFELDNYGELVRLFWILDFLICIYNLLQDMHHLGIINKITDYNLFGIFLLVLVIYLRYISLKIKRIRWNSLSNNTKVVNWKYLIQNNNFDQYKGEAILYRLLKQLNLENLEITVSANTNFEFYKQFVEKLQSLPRRELRELYNYLKMQNRENYNWSFREIMSANLGKIFISFLISLLSISSLMQLCTNLKKEMILNGMVSFLNYYIFFYVLLFLFFYLVKILIYSVFIPYQRKIRNKNIEAFLLSTLRSALDRRLK